VVPLLVLVLLQSTSAPSVAAWQAELDTLAQEVAESLGRPAWSHRNHDPDTTRFVEDLKLASVWPHPLLRAPLLKLILAEEPGIVTLAAEGLLRYDEPELRRRVEALRDDPRDHWYLSDVRSTLGHSIKGVLDRADHEPNAVTIPAAAAVLRDDDPAARLRAFAWLAQQGVILDASPLADAWPKLSEGERRKLLEFSRIRLGRDRLRTTLEALLARHRRYPHGDYVLAALVRGLGRAQSPQARDLAIEVITAYVRRAPHKPARPDDKTRAADHAQRELVKAAFVAWRPLSVPADLELALDWARSPHEVVRCGALALLAQSDEPRACEAVMQFIRSGTAVSFRDWEIDPYEALCERSWSDTAVKWKYLRAVEAKLYDAVRVFDEPSTDPRLVWPAAPLDKLIETLEAATQMSFGGRSCLPRDAAAAALRKAAEDWHHWMQEHAP
jgi:hypothetical protein